MTAIDQEPIPEFEGYQAVKRVRSGPVADLYEALQRPLGRRVLIKALSASILPSSPFAATLEREARLLAELDHPSILHLYDFVRTGSRMWLVLEHVDGFTLEEVISRSVRLPPAAACAIALEVARGLEHAHGHRIVHRDLQPRNVLVSARGQVKLIGFAVAVDERLPTAPELLDRSAALGGPAYMSPEQILGEPADPRSDIFSLGVLLYEALTGQGPFTGPDDRTTTQRIRHDAPAPIGRAARGIPASLERVVIHCLEKLPSHRFQSAAEVSAALRRVLEEVGARHVHETIHEALLGAKIVGGTEARVEDAPVSLVAKPGRSLTTATLGLVVAAAVAVGGGAAIEYGASDYTPAARPGQATRLELVPARAGYLRVLADPWAHVVVDGQRVETTPFAHPIPLTAGTHHVRLEHPNAATERRTIRVAAGETVTLDVTMAIPASAIPSAPPPPPPSASASAEPPSP
ncbi:MAG: serine/threonine protein kinase [Polyangiaceae bacterium]|nr:serine/threonine protein kinase [Polyangiaceae bacterium]